MQLTIAQIVALTAYGNTFLSGSHQLEPSAFYPAHFTFRHCEYVKFVDLKPTDHGQEEITYAPNPVVWFAQLKQENTYGLRMVRQSRGKARNVSIPDHVRIAFVGGESWLIEAMKPTGSDFWVGKWEINRPVEATANVEATAKKEKARSGWLGTVLFKHRESPKKATQGPPLTWRVTYGRIAKDQPTVDQPNIDLFALKNQFIKTLSEIRDFARDFVVPDIWAATFDRALAELTSDKVADPVVELIPDKKLALLAAQLLRAADTAWVFGGMGSWNDVQYPAKSHDRYTQLSNELFHLLESVESAVANATIPK